MSNGQTNLAVAFSGGGIRSASLCSGVLHYLVENDTKYKIEYLSSVSGGGYIASSYLHFRSLLGKGTNQKEAFKTFLRNFRNNVGYFVDLSSFESCAWWSTKKDELFKQDSKLKIGGFIWKFLSLFASIVSILLMILIWILVFIFSTIPLAFPMAHVIGIIYKNVGHDYLPIIWESCIVLGIIAIVFKKICECIPFGNNPFNDSNCCNTYHFKKTLLDVVLGVSIISFSLGALLFSVFLEEEISSNFYNVFSTLFSTGIFVGAKVMAPKLGVMLLGKLTVYVKSSFFEILILIPIYVRVISIYVLKQDFFFKYSENAMWYIWIIAMICCGTQPIFSLIKRNLFHAFYKWRLQSAFYAYPDDALSWESWFKRQVEALISIFPCASCFGGNTFASISKGDLPTYVCNVTVNGWTTIEGNVLSNPYDLVAIESKKSKDEYPTLYRYALGTTNETSKQENISFNHSAL